MGIGKLWNWFGTGRGMAIIVIQLLLVLAFAYFYTGYQSSARCVGCHADKARMTKLGYPQFFMTREQVQKEARHPNTECRDCHLGNGLSDVPSKAHKGMSFPARVMFPGFSPRVPTGCAKCSRGCPTAAWTSTWAPFSGTTATRKPSDTILRWLKKRAAGPGAIRTR
jgi:hypothetical protein